MSAGTPPANPSPPPEGVLEQIARIIEPSAFETETPQNNRVYRNWSFSDAREDAFAKARQIAALQAADPPEAEERVAAAIYAERGPRVWDLLHDRWVEWADLSRYAKAPFLKTAQAALSALHQAGKPADPREAETYTAFQQRRGAAWDIIAEALASYESWMLDDDYDAQRCLTGIINRMEERRKLYDADPPSPEAPEGGLAGISATHERVSGLQHGYQLGLVGDRVELNRLIELHWREIRDERAALAASAGEKG